MPADEVTHGTDVDESRVRTGPRHAAPKKPLFTRFHMPAGKAIATVAMPTAVLVGMGFTSSLALADTSSPAPSSSSLTADEYKDCVTALDASKDPSATPTPTASASASESTGTKDTATPTPTASATTQNPTSGKTSSSDSGTADKATPEPSATPSSGSSDTSSSSGGDTATATPSPSATSGNLLDTIGDAIKDVFTGGSGDATSTASASPTPSASASTSSDSKASGSTATDTVKDTAGTATKTVDDTVKKVTDTATTAAQNAADATATATASPSPSASSTTSADNCPAATDATSGVDNKVPVADEPWYLNASSLLLKSADYQGIVEVKTANGTTKKVLKYVISGGTDIGDLHQTVKDKQSGKTYHVQAASGSTSTIRDGDTVMYTESISGNLFGLIPVTFSPDSPPPLNIPLIYFTNVKVTQAAQFGGSLHVPGMQVYTTD
ncbi:hypothetical protein [Streptomyces sp. HUAS TT20]|uniref:hypothetical protein n=1 Tax=Streptomyces sp. HUAS TT20 TaxID=3447509 RepID=UPI0021DB0B15|nr:hypothetical protein [Streptomyces sp. HUAS 15-9]UXY30014.1 hypothetical protein N8I87_27990 [Streptomyces sp. HUAS 15-9]